VARLDSEPPDPVGLQEEARSTADITGEGDIKSAGNTGEDRLNGAMVGSKLLESRLKKNFPVIADP